GSAVAVKRALEGEVSLDTIPIGEKLFDVVSIPVAGGSGALVGGLTLGSEIRSADMQDFSLRSGSEVVLLADGRVLATTAHHRSPHRDFATLFSECAAASRRTHGSAPMERTLLGEEHYFCSAGEFPSLSSGGKLGYLLLSSYEDPLRTLQHTQQMVLW